MLNFHFMILVKPALLTCVHSDLIHRQAYGTFILRLAPAVCSSLGNYCSLFALSVLWRWGDLHPLSFTSSVGGSFSLFCSLSFSWDADFQHWSLAYFRLPFAVLVSPLC